MRAIEKTKVPYMVLNTNRCRCTLSPVQADSECIQEKYSRLENELESPGGVEALEPQKVPGVYFSAGTATCSDLNFADNVFAIPVLSGKDSNKRNRHR